MKKKLYSLEEVLDSILYEQELDQEIEDDEAEQTDQENDSEQDSSTEKEKDLKKKELSDVEKDDLEQDDEIEEEEVAVTLKLNSEAPDGGKIKFVPYRRLTSLVNIENVLNFLNVNSDNIPDAYKNQLVITINSPLRDFKDEQYVIKLMDGIGELTIHRPDFKNTITKHGSGGAMPMDQAVQQQTGDEEPAKEPAKPIDLSYLPQLNYEFEKAVKNEFFDRIISAGRE